MIFLQFIQLSLVEYDPSTDDLRTVSLHYFEDEDIKVHINVLVYTFSRCNSKQVLHL